MVLSAQHSANKFSQNLIWQVVLLSVFTNNDIKVEEKSKWLIPGTRLERLRARIQTKAALESAKSIPCPYLLLQEKAFTGRVLSEGNLGIQEYGITK
jgi:hypothetical protein